MHSLYVRERLYIILIFHNIKNKRSQYGSLNSYKNK